MKKSLVLLLLFVFIFTISLSACSTDNVTSSDDTATASAETASSIADSSAEKLEQPNEVVATANVTSDGAIDASGIFSKRDLRQTADVSEAVYYTLSDNSNITIDTEGVYVISGSAANAQIIVEADDKDKVQLVLNGVNISNSSTPAIYVKNADKVFVTTVKGTTNSLSVTGTFTADGTTNTDAVIFSKDDLVLNGLGTLNINSTDNGITGKDDLKITGGTINITCTGDALEANESIAVADGTITINTDKDGLHAEDNDDNATGYIYICGGTFDITAADDGMQGTTILQIDGGDFTISALEGLEATYVQINGGTINISASDDGINASAKSKFYAVTVEINGGDIAIDMAQGDTDAIDSNGNLYINGGTLDIDAESPFDYDGQGEYNGGTIYVNGSETTELTNQMIGGGMHGGMDGGMPDDRGGMPGDMGGGFRGW